MCEHTRRQYMDVFCGTYGAVRCGSTHTKGCIPSYTQKRSDSGTLTTLRSDAIYPYWATLYNMDMIVALAFRIHSYGAEKIRDEVLKRICGRKEKVCYLFSLANSPVGMS